MFSTLIHVVVLKLFLSLAYCSHPIFYLRMMASPTKPGQGPEPYSELEVVTDKANHAPELDLRDHSDKEAASLDDKKLPSASQRRRRICGITRPLAILVFAITSLVILGAVVGGAVAGTHASSKDKE